MELRREEVLNSVLDPISDPVTHLEQNWMHFSLTSTLHVFSWKRLLSLCGMEVDPISDPGTHLEQNWMPSSLTSNLHVFSWKRLLSLCGMEVCVVIMGSPGSEVGDI